MTSEEIFLVTVNDRYWSSYRSWSRLEKESASMAALRDQQLEMIANDFGESCETVKAQTNTCKCKYKVESC